MCGHAILHTREFRFFYRRSAVAAWIEEGERERANCRAIVNRERKLQAGAEFDLRIMFQLLNWRARRRKGGKEIRFECGK